MQRRFACSMRIWLRQTLAQRIEFSLATEVAEGAENFLDTD
jgi:hypothetical protein